MYIYIYLYIFSFFFICFMKAFLTTVVFGALVQPGFVHELDTRKFIMKKHKKMIKGFLLPGGHRIESKGLMGGIGV